MMLMMDGLDESTRLSAAFSWEFSCNRIAFLMSLISILGCSLIEPSNEEHKHGDLASKRPSRSRVDISLLCCRFRSC